MICENCGKKISGVGACKYCGYSSGGNNRGNGFYDILSGGGSAGAGGEVYGDNSQLLNVIADQNKIRNRYLKRLVKLKLTGNVILVLILLVLMGIGGFVIKDSLNISGKINNEKVIAGTLQGDEISIDKLSAKIDETNGKINEKKKSLEENLKKIQNNTDTKLTTEVKKLEGCIDALGGIKTQLTGINDEFKKQNAEVDAAILTEINNELVKIDTELKEQKLEFKNINEIKNNLIKINEKLAKGKTEESGESNTEGGNQAGENDKKEQRQ